jgi:hypothetical protein
LQTFPGNPRPRAWPRPVESRDRRRGVHRRGSVSPMAPRGSHVFVQMGS